MLRRLLWPLLLTGLAANAFAQDALLDSLLVWRDASRPDRVDSVATPAIATARAEGDTTRLIHLLLIRGATRAGFGHARLAENDLRETIVLAEARDDTLRRLQGTRWLGVSLGLQGRGTEAAATYSLLEDMAYAAADSFHLGWAWVGLAYGHYLQGRTHAAGATYARAAGVLERYGEVAGAAWAWNGRALALRAEGRYREAREAFERVLALAVAGGDAVNEAAALNFLGRLDLQLGDPGRAVKRFRQAAAIHRAHQHHREGLLPCIDLANALTSQGRYAEAEADLDSVLAVTRELGLRDLEALAVGNLVGVRLDQGRPGAAAALCRELLAGGEMPSHLVDTETRLALARALADRDSLAAAAAVLESVLEVGAGSVMLELRTRALLGSLLVDSGEADRAAEVLRPAVAKAREAGAEGERVVLLTHLGRAEAARDRPDSALAAFGRAMASWEQVRAWPADPVWREHQGTVAGSLFAEAAATRLVAGGPGHLAEAWSWVQRHKARTLQERMRGPDAAAPEADLPVLEEFRREVLHPGEVFLDLVEGERVAVMFCVTRDTVLAGVLPGRAATRPGMDRLADVVTSPDVAEPGPALNLAGSLVETWPEGMLPLAATAPLVVWSPDGSWHGLPVALLEWDGALARIPAAGVLARLRGAPTPPPDKTRILAVCGPDPEGPGLLPGAEAEARWLSGNLRHVRRASETAMTTDWEGTDVLHLAAHTGLDPWQPWNTTITLGRDPADAVRAAEVADLSLSARLAVLAGCTTVGTRLVGGEGLIGLAGAFLVARTPVVLATLWPVDDAVAQLVTRDFYSGLADGLPVATALERARNACRAHPAGAAPRHWAAFVVVGDGEVEVPVRRRAPRWPWAALLAGVALAIFLRSRR